MNEIDTTLVAFSYLSKIALAAAALWAVSAFLTRLNNRAGFSFSTWIGAGDDTGRDNPGYGIYLGLRWLGICVLLGSILGCQAQAAVNSDVLPSVPAHDLINGLTPPQTKFMSQSLAIFTSFGAAANIQNLIGSEFMHAIPLASIVCVVALLVGVILFVRSPSEIIGATVGGIAIPMCYFMFLRRARSVERGAHQSMDSDGGMAFAIVKSDVGVSVSVSSEPKDLSDASTASPDRTSYSPAIADFVRPSIYGAPLFVLLFVSVCAHAEIIPSRYDQLIKSASETWMPGLPWELWKSQLYAESRLQPEAVSPVGARGLAQFMPATWREVSAALKYDISISPHAVEPAILAGAYYMAHQRRAWRLVADFDRHRLACAGYNAGLGNIRKASRAAQSTQWTAVSAALSGITGRHAKETQTYIERIWRWYAVLSV